MQSLDPQEVKRKHKKYEGVSKLINIYVPFVVETLGHFEDEALDRT
jgi:hypothetical protein